MLLGRRLVSELPPAQLARKRARDREAQRASRARAKNYIRKLEIELSSLRSLLCGGDTFKALWSDNKASVERLGSLRATIEAQSCKLQHTHTEGAHRAASQFYVDSEVMTSANSSIISVDVVPSFHTTVRATPWQNLAPHDQPGTGCIVPNTHVGHLLLPRVECCRTNATIDNYSGLCNVHAVSRMTDALNDTSIGVGIWNTVGADIELSLLSYH